MALPSREIATAIADKWGPTFTKSVVDGDLKPFQELFDDVVTVVLQNGEGLEAEFTMGNGSEAEVDLTWDEFQQLATKDLEEQGYEKTEAQCLGVLGDRVLMETGRFNKQGELYSEAYCLLTINASGKITVYESFSDPQAASLMSTVAPEK